MTCEDCIHFTDEQNTQFPDLVCFHLCNGAKTPFWVESDCKICDAFEPTHESVGNALDALDSWESVSK